MFQTSKYSHIMIIHLNNLKQYIVIQINLNYYNETPNSAFNFFNFCSRLFLSPFSRNNSKYYHGIHYIYTKKICFKTHLVGLCDKNYIVLELKQVSKK